ncbi:ion channel [Bythopirellula goksoeyrii]|uniref:Ion channel n=1 Tax=Bythopirellula goksoeyrii TaxID=1400387 RepID=A0A5B9QL80_9BACT|nr:ion channel [Bythopirellula goksoeyrii]QEG37816.1 Ion channel [Bythopirellula goksoeyrii]
MIANLFYSSLIIVCCVFIQTLFVAILLRIFIRLDEKGLIRMSIFRSSLLLSLITLIMLIGNLVQIAIWGGFFIVIGEFSDMFQAFSHSAVNFTTLGYGDVVMSQERRILGALEAANGMVMFGVTTSVLFSFMSILIKRRSIKESRSLPIE